MCEAALQNHSIHVKTSVNDDVAIGGYPNEYSQVILNLLSNARDVLDKKNGNHKLIEIEITKTNDGRSCVRISDNGGGISEEIFDKIFDPYFTTKFMAEGAGIGLYMAKMIIDYTFAFFDN
jgi:signal transduction histidine kinase